jgi:hypothetical protein
MITYVYESPDHGRTVYRREVGHDKRELYMESGSPVLYPYGMWADIQRVAMSNLALQEAMERVIILYNLTKPDK